MTTLERQSVVVPADWMIDRQQGQWTYAGYATLPEDGHRYEVVDGILYMAPAPNPAHQQIAGEIFALLRDFTRKIGSGKVFIAPVDVELDDKNIVQPDVLFLLQEHLDRVHTSRIIGAPDLFVEVASPGTVRHDLGEKLQAYARAGVPEYWIVTPSACTVEVLIIKHAMYRSRGLFCTDDLLPSTLLPEFAVKVAQFFPV